MGFRMRSEDSSSWLLHGMHLALALAIPLFLTLMIGCKKVEAEKTDYGPEISGDAIDHALSKAINGASLSNVTVGQYVDYDVNRRLENEETVTTLGATRIMVIDKEENSDRVKFTLRITKSTRMNDGTFETKVTEEPMFLDKQKEQTSLSQVAASRYSSESLKARAMAEATPLKKTTKVTFHRLQEFTEPLAAPPLTKNRADCGGLTDCQMMVRYIRFDMVQWYDDGSQQKISLDFGFSLDTPYLPFGEEFDQLSGLLVLDCRSTYIPIEGRTVYLRDCQTLEDLQK